MDIWREKCGSDNQQFSWFKSSGSSKSRIDLWLVNNNLCHLISNVSIDAAPLTDHSVIKMEIKPPISQKRNKGYWKLNSSLLLQENFCKTVNTLIRETINDKNLETKMQNGNF